MPNFKVNVNILIYLNKFAFFAMKLLVILI